MKEGVNKYLKSRLETYTSLRGEYNKKLKALDELHKKVKDDPSLAEKDSYEYDHMYLILLQTDKNRAAVEFNIVKDLLNKLEIDLSEEIEEYIEENDIQEIQMPYETPTFISSGDSVVEREPGIVKVKLDMVKKSEAYKQIEELRGSVK